MQISNELDSAEINTDNLEALSPNDFQIENELIEYANILIDPLQISNEEIDLTEMDLENLETSNQNDFETEIELDDYEDDFIDLAYNQFSKDNVEDCSITDETDDDFDFFENSEIFHESLNIKKSEVVFMILSYYLRYNLTWNALEGLLSLLNGIFGKTVIQNSKYLFRKLFPSSIKPQYHFYCSTCNFYFDPTISKTDPSNVCEVCGLENSFNSKKSTNYFITLPLMPQLKNILKSKSLMTESSTVHTDIQDSLLYKAVKVNHSNKLITLTFNTDGVSIFKSSRNSSFWPVQMVINDLDPKIRFQTENIIVCGFWFGSTPNMDMFLKPFINEINKINRIGVDIKIMSTIQKFDIFPMLCSLDTIAKDVVQCKKQFNGYCGCSYCLHPGTKVLKQIRYTNLPNIQNRNHIESLNDMKEAQINNIVVNGFKKLTPLVAINDFDIVNGFVIDHMHSIDLGVVRQMLELWFDSSNHNQPYYLGLRVKIIDETFSKISPTQKIARKRSIESRHIWKAHEFKNWLLYFGIPCLYKQLPLTYLKHFALLSDSIYLLLKEKISEDDIQTAEFKLRSFVLQFEELYGSKNMTYNVHLMSHIANCVKNCGPLWAYSNYSFETNNGILKKFNNGTTDVLKQIVSKYMFHKFSQSVGDKIPPRVDNFIRKIQFDRHVKKIDKMDNTVSFIGTAKPHNLNLVELSLFDSLGHFSVSNIQSYDRVILKNEIFTTTAYSNKIKTNDSLVILSNNEFGLIKNILRLNDECYLLLNMCLKKIKNCVEPAFGLCSHLILVEKLDDEFILILSSQILKKGLLVPTEHSNYITSFPNTIEHE